jgi:hypothetical protein
MATETLNLLEFVPIPGTGYSWKFEPKVPSEEKMTPERRDLIEHEAIVNFQQKKLCIACSGTIYTVIRAVYPDHPCWVRKVSQDMDLPYSTLDDVVAELKKELFGGFPHTEDDGRIIASEKYAFAPFSDRIRHPGLDKKSNLDAVIDGYKFSVNSPDDWSIEGGHASYVELPRTDELHFSRRIDPQLAKILGVSEKTKVCYGCMSYCDGISSARWNYAGWPTIIPKMVLYHGPNETIPNSGFLVGKPEPKIRGMELY